MISSFIGVPGSGKSTGLAWVCRQAARKPNKPIYICGYCVSSGHPTVFSNFYLEGAYQFNFKDIKKYHFEDCLILIDEISMCADSRNYKNFDSDLIEFFTQHRKDKIDIIWCSQAYDDSDKKIRNLTVAYFMMCPIFSWLNSFQLIEPFNDIVDYRLVSGYSFGKRQFFLTKPCFKLFDSYSKVSSRLDSLPPAPIVAWSEPPTEEPQTEEPQTEEPPTEESQTEEPQTEEPPQALAYFFEKIKNR